MTTQLVTQTDLRSAVGAAVQAPSIHNSQPWRFRLGKATVEVYADRSRQMSVTDPDGKALRVSCGAAIFNIRLAVAQLGFASQTILLPDPSQPDLLARVRTGDPHPATPAEQVLFAAIPRRHSNRQPFLSAAVPLEAQARLTEAARAENAWLDIMIGHEARYLVAELTRTADDVLSLDPAYRLELASWMRSDDNAPDGVPREAGGPAPAPTDLLARRDFGGRPRTGAGEFEADPMLAVLGAYGDAPRDDLVAGQALQRVLLTATSSGLITSMFSQPVDVPHIREQLRLGLRRPGPPQMVLRMGYGPAGYSPARRPIDEVLLPPSSTDSPHEGP
jgi:hypothetical protein